MAVDEPGHQRLAGKILQHRAVALLLECIRLAADEGDLAVVHDDRLDGDRLVAFHRDDGAAGDDEVRGRDGGGVGRLSAAAGKHEGGDEDRGEDRAACHGGSLGYGP